MQTSRTLQLTRTIAVICLFSSLLLGCRGRHDADVTTKQLVGQWRYDHTDGATNARPGNMIFTISADGGYSSRVSNSSGSHTLEGRVEVKDGLFILTTTKRDNVDVSLVDRQTIVRFDGGELVTRSEGSTVDNVFRKDAP